MEEKATGGGGLSESRESLKLEQVLPSVTRSQVLRYRSWQNAPGHILYMWESDLLALCYDGIPDNIMVSDWKARQQHTSLQTPSGTCSKDDNEVILSEVILSSMETCTKVGTQCVTHNTILVCDKVRKRIGVKDSTGIFRHRYKLVKSWVCPVMVKTTSGNKKSSLGEDNKSGRLQVAASLGEVGSLERGSKRLRDSKKVPSHVTSHVTRR